jgi:hypothetical protein
MLVKILLGVWVVSVLLFLYFYFFDSAGDSTLGV